MFGNGGNMKGLIKSNLYTTLLNAKVFSVTMVLLGIFVIAMDAGSPFLISCLLSVMIGFSFISLESIGLESTSKWVKHKLTSPVKRSDIVKSLYLSLLLWLSIGVVFAGISVALSAVLHGYPFDRNTDVFMLFVAGIGISLFMGAVFFPLFLLGGEERNGVFLIVSILCGIGIVIGISVLINSFFPNGMTTRQSILGGTAVLACAALAFILSCPLTVYLFQRKEY